MYAEPRTRFQGVAQIVRFNWPFYAGSALLLMAALWVGWVVQLPGLARGLWTVGITMPAGWLISSLAVAHYIYDRNSIYDGRWIERSLHAVPQYWVTFHAGLDEFSAVLRKQFPNSKGMVIDFFDAVEMTERSIQRARDYAMDGPTSIHVNFRALPMPNEEFDALFVFFAAHELRRPKSRTVFFRELRRVMRPNGQLILLEHLRDWPNFFAFGPGSFHFHSRASWLRALRFAGLAVAEEFKFTPFLRAFVVEKAPDHV
jgi:SAM-dependent methyltransferase